MYDEYITNHFIVISIFLQHLTFDIVYCFSEMLNTPY
jgi:hypothetical protein